METPATKTKMSELEKLKLFYEHTDDSRLLVDKQARPIKRPRRNIASLR